MENELPRNEYPRPQFIRSEWMSLNGVWQFEIDQGDSGLARGLVNQDLTGKIIVPFCPESELSGVGNTDFLNAVWYRRKVTIPERWAGKVILLHFQAVDYDASVWVNGVEVGLHRGGFSPFTCSLKGVAEAGREATIVVRARDSHLPPQPRGKQSQRYEKYSCLYTRTTGIWQTVWMEPVPDIALLRPRITPDAGGSRFMVQQALSGNLPGLRIKMELSSPQGPVSAVEIAADRDLAPVGILNIPAELCHLWEPGNPYLYDLSISLIDSLGNTIDQAQCYAGLRSIVIEGKQVKINNKTVFQRLVLDQGYYPDGILTAPSDAALIEDIQLSLAAGFNGARLHQKVFEERFLYHADRLGYLVWGEFPDWGCGHYGTESDHQQPGPSYITQWLEVIERDYSHPSIIGWCPLNETWQVLEDRISVLDDVTRGMFLATKALDQTRPVLDASGYSHRVPESDIYDSHNYEQDVEKFAVEMAGLAHGQPYLNQHVGKAISIPYRNQPYFVSEFGGIWWNPAARQGEDSWGYGNPPASLAEFYQRFEGMCNTLLDNPAMFGYCYTQLTDVYQEQNGIYTFDRREKFDLKRLSSIQQRQAAIEREG